MHKKVTLPTALLPILPQNVIKNKTKNKRKVSWLIFKNFNPTQIKYLTFCYKHKLFIRKKSKSSTIDASTYDTGWLIYDKHFFLRNHGIILSQWMKMNAYVWRKFYLKMVSINGQLNVKPTNMKIIFLYFVAGLSYSSSTTIGWLIQWLTFKKTSYEKKL